VSHTGPLSLSIPLSPFGWIRLPDDADVFRDSPDPSAGPNSPHIEFEFQFGINPQSDLTGIGNSPPLTAATGLADGNSLGMTVINLHPFSREAFKPNPLGFISCNFG
jgi:hypothetical protein